VEVEGGDLTNHAGRAAKRVKKERGSEEQGNAVKDRSGMVREAKVSVLMLVCERK
jgi:hypothetical protein